MATRNRIVEKMKSIGNWTSAMMLAATLKLANNTAQSHVKALVEEGKAEDNGLKGKNKAYRAIADIQAGDETSHTAAARTS